MHRARLIAALGLVVLVVVGVSWWRLATRPRAKLFFGIDVPSGRVEELSAVQRVAGTAPTVENIFLKFDSTFSVDKLEQIRQHGMTPMISLEPWQVHDRWTGQPMPQYRLSDIAAGRYDRQLRAIARVVKDFNHPVYLRFAHEMNGNWYPWAERVNGNHPGDFVAAWRHVYPILRGGNPLVTLIWSPNALLPPDQSTPLSELFPGDRYVDAVGFTAYGHGRSASATLDPTYRALAQLSHRPMILSETGADGNGRADWINSLGNYLREHGRLAGFVWFNTSPETTGASGDYRFTADPAAAAAFARMLRRLPLLGPTSG